MSEQAELFPQEGFRPCPFCGRTNGFQVKTVWKTYRFVGCKCHASGPVCRTDEEAVAAWNRRAE